jgi:hypothetical protein
MILNGVYDYGRGWVAVDITISESPDEIDWFGFYVDGEDPDVCIGASPYMEQFLNPAGTCKLCETWDEPDDYDEKELRIVFFVEPGKYRQLITPYGNIDLSETVSFPDNIKCLIEFEFPK